MSTEEKLKSLRILFEDTSKKLAGELLKPVPDRLIITECRKQLTHIDKDIYRLQVQKYHH